MTEIKQEPLTKEQRTILKLFKELVKFLKNLEEEEEND